MTPLDAPRPGAHHHHVDDKAFADFLAHHKPLIRPEGTLVRMRRALSVDAEFLAEFEVLRGYLRPLLAKWSDALLGYLRQFPEFQEKFIGEEERLLRPMMIEHSKQLALGRFDEAYLDTIEDLALFFIYFDVRSIWVAGAYQSITRDAIDLVFKRAMERRAIRVRQLMKILVSSLALELNQIQRVYTIYERGQYRALIEDLKSGEPLAEEMWDAHELDLPELDGMAVLRVKKSYESIAWQSRHFARAFTDALADRSIEAREFVGEDRAAFARAALEVIARMVGALDSPAALRPGVLRASDAISRHRVSPKLANEIADVLVTTVGRASGTRWREADAEAWRSVYGAVANAAIAHAQKSGAHHDAEAGVAAAG